MAGRIVVTPVYEQDEFHGWVPCDDARATLFEVGDEDDVIDHFTTRAEAEAYLARLTRREDQ